MHWKTLNAAETVLFTIVYVCTIEECFYSLQTPIGYQHFVTMRPRRGRGVWFETEVRPRHQADATQNRDRDLCNAASRQPQAKGSCLEDYITATGLLMLLMFVIGK